MSSEPSQERTCMAYLKNCTICNTPTREPGDHSECVNARLIDLLARIQKRIQDHSTKRLPKKLREEILAETPQSLETFLQRKFDAHCKRQQQIGQDAFRAFKSMEHITPPENEKRYAKSA